MSICHYCNKKLGYFEFSSVVFPGSGHFACQSCHDLLIEHVDEISSSTNDDQLIETYQKFCKELNSLNLASTDSILNDFNAYCQEKSKGRLDSLISQHNDYLQYQKKKEAEERAEQERIRQRTELESALEEERIQSINPKYEYTTYYLYDSVTGAIDQTKLNSVLNEYSSKGWRLVSATTNELGKNALTLMGVNINSTVEVMVMIFERMIRPASKHNL